MRICRAVALLMAVFSAVLVVSYMTPRVFFSPYFHMVAATFWLVAFQLFNSFK